jgi:hypothetical protein
MFKVSAISSYEAFDVRTTAARNSGGGVSSAAWTSWSRC